MKQPVKPQTYLRSYVLRQGRFSAQQRTALKNLWSKYVLTLDSADFAQSFNRNVPQILEIGFGMGDNLLAMAKQMPGYNFIGIEVHKPGIAKLLSGLEQQKIQNVVIFNADAVKVLQQVIADESLAQIWIFFPDPWPKRRHHKRRLIQTELVQLLVKKLQKQGSLHLATDWQDYAVHMMQILSANADLKNSAGEGKFAPRSILRPTTKFERRGEKLGHAIWDLVFIKQN